ncbi:uncharacterized protein [Coffea arabica]|uniref:Uncharacterized protein LOC113688276 n=1 Tax=Coffea arabica TaxID=13443 RepID=A0A6P6S7T2_COFAR|nr:uncharacterized protein LOC113688276 [Coffea arabica]XP_027061860.1 uncharacterized protein LOC113688276 [Coffea arabica]
MRLSQANSPKGASSSKKELKGAAASGSSEKLKASNFPATILRIGTWEYKSRYEGDLVAKCYFAKHKLVREVLDGGLKNKIEIQWSDIMALKANYPDDGPGTLDVVGILINGQFLGPHIDCVTDDNLIISVYNYLNEPFLISWHHFLQCPQGLLGKHFEKLIQCDPRLNFLSK